MSQHCCLCKESAELRFCCVNSKDRISFPYIHFGQAAHLECYIDLCMKRSVEKTQEKLMSDVEEPTYCARCHAVQHIKKTILDLIEFLDQKTDFGIEQTNTAVRGLNKVLNKFIKKSLALDICKGKDS